jgi:hypothetical protein
MYVICTIAVNKRCSGEEAYLERDASALTISQEISGDIYCGVCPFKISFQFISKASQNVSQFLLVLLVSERAFRAYAFPFIILGGANCCRPNSKINIDQEIEGFFAQQLIQDSAFPVNLSYVSDPEGVREDSFENLANSIDFPARQLAHKLHDCLTFVGEDKLTIGQRLDRERQIERYFVLIRSDLCQKGV